MTYTIMSGDNPKYAVVMELTGEMRFGKHVVQIPGRWPGGTGSTGVCEPKELFGQYDTIEQAQAILETAHEVRNMHDACIKELEKQLRDARGDQAAAWREVIGQSLLI
jgi:hypothetical protein